MTTTETQCWKVSTDGERAIAQDVYWLPIEEAPYNVECFALTRHRVTNRTVLTPKNIKDYVAWHPMFREPEWLKSK